MTFTIRRAAAALAAVFLLCGPCAVPAGAQTQQGPPPGGYGGHRGNPMAKILANLNPPLSDAQKGQIRTIMANARKQNENVTDREQRRANMRKASDEIRTVLTPAQRTQYDAQVKAMRARYQQQQQQGGGNR